MTRVVPLRTVGGEFDEFLYAPIAEEGNGMLLSVLSALARRNVDPWDEASRLARLPRDAATRFLATLIAALPDESSARANPELHAKRLTALLPQRVAIDFSQSKPIFSRVSIADRQGLVRHLVVFVMITALFFGAQWLIERSRQATRSGVDESLTTSHSLVATPASASASPVAPERP